MHRSIVNMIRSLLFHASLPPTFWVEALHKVVHILNILPSSTINFRTLFELLFGKSPTYDHLRVFGCSCYPNIRDYFSHKLSPLSKHCVILGYPSNYM